MTIPTDLKLYLDLAALAAVAILVGLFVHQQRDIGRKEILDADAKLAASTLQHNADVQAVAAANQAVSAAAYRALVAGPVSNPISVRVCKPAAPAGNTGGADGGAGSSTHDATGLPSGVGQEAPGEDIGPFTDKLLDDATNQVKALQQYIRDCQTEGVCLR